MRVHIDETRGDDEPPGVQDPLGRRRRGRAFRSHGGDPAAVDRDVGPDWWETLPVDDRRAPDEEIGHGSSSMGATDGV